MELNWVTYILKNGRWEIGASSSDPKERCDFCEQQRTGVTLHARGWKVCPGCSSAAKAQAERIYAGLVDCPETRRDALRWANAQG